MKRWQRVSVYSTLALAGALILLAACGGDGGGSVLLASPIPRPEGRTVTSDDGKLTLEIPPRALDEEIEITITAVPLEELPEELQVVRGAGGGYRLEPDGLEFSKPVAVTLELSRVELEDEPEDGITGYALVSFTAGGERELLDQLRTEASLGEDTVVVRGELSHFSWLGRTKGSLTVLLEEVQRKQPVAGQFQAKATWANTDASGTVTLGSGVAEYLASGSVQVAGDVFAVQDDIMPGQEVEGGTLYQCSDSPGPGSYGVLVTLRSTVEAGDETIVTRLRVVVSVAITCGDDDDEAFELPPPGEYSFDVEATIEFTITEEAVSAVATAGQQTFSGSGTGSAGIDFGTGGSGTFGDMKIDFTIERGEGGAVKLTLSESPERDSTVQVGSDGTSANLFLNVDLPADLVPGAGGEIVGGYIFPVGRPDDPVPLESRDVDFFKPLTLQFPDDVGRVSLARRDTEETAVDIVADILAMTLMLTPIDGQAAPPEEEPESCSGAGTTCTLEGATCDDGAICTGSGSTCSGAATECTGSGSTCTEGATCPGSSEPAPGVDILDVEVAVGCDHRIPGEESDVIVKVQSLQPGQTVTGFVSGPGVIGDGTFSATAGEDGTAEARVPINQFGSYEARVLVVDEFDLGLSAIINVGDVCTAP